MRNQKCSIIICTYQRPLAICKLLGSLCQQTLKAEEVIVVDGSPAEETEKAIQKADYPLPMHYVRVKPEQRGLTRQRNVGVSLLSPETEIVLFLDDDVIPEKDFTRQLLSVFEDPEVVGADGLITNDCAWKRLPHHGVSSFFNVIFEGYYRPLPLRDMLRKILGLYPSHIQPGLIPRYGHGKSYLPPTGISYTVEHIMGGITAYRRNLFEKIQFSPYFEGYGLYEDFDFSIRASRFGKLLTVTAARIEHYHDPGGRPNTRKYGNMVVRNGWHVWRLKHPQPGRTNVLKWHLITLLLAWVRLLNACSLNTEKRRMAWGDFIGRMEAWFRLFWDKPNPQYVSVEG